MSSEVESSSALIRQAPAACVPRVIPGPRSQITRSLPSSVIVSTTESAISSTAFSQEIRCHLLEPRGPTCLRGWRMRAGSYMRSLKHAPFWQPRGLKSGTSGRTCG
jgi:hypothetical protein